MTKRFRGSILIVVVFMALVVGTVYLPSFQNITMTSFGGFIGGVFIPVKTVLDGITDSVETFFVGFAERRELYSLNQDLTERVSWLEQELLDKNELELENERLKSLLNFAQQSERITFSGVNIVGKSPGEWFDVFTVDAGTNAGIENDMAVINSQGLVGRVFEVSDDWSKVMSLVDPRSAVSAMVIRTRDNGVVRSNNILGYEKGFLRISFLPLNADLIVGDEIVTSGLDGVFPSGILIGKVKEILIRDYELYTSAIIEPAVDFRRLNEVLMIKQD